MAADEIKEAGLSAEAVLLEAPLYLPVDLPRREMVRLFYDGFPFDAHCIYCKSLSPFVVERSTYREINQDKLTEWLYGPGVARIAATCQRQKQHVYQYWLLTSNKKVSKVGQTPSLEDIAGADIEKYRSQLKGGAFAELRRATGLASHGIGIGAFVYLRRIFERLIHEHRAVQEAQTGPIKDWNTMRMDERIKSLSAVLPPSLVSNASVYSILSKGLHELGENECKLYFPVVRAAIIVILEEDWIQRERRKKEADLAKQIQEIHQTLKSAPQANEQAD